MSATHTIHTKTPYIKKSDVAEKNDDQAPDALVQEGSVFLIDKPKHKTSFAVVRRVRRLLGIKKTGHAGTLDPFATGLLIVCAGRSATRFMDRFMEGRKTYLARLQLGIETDTHDPEGQVVATAPVPPLDQRLIADCLSCHVGPQLQAPPAWSAAKHQGKPLYAYARKGIIVEKPAKAIEIYTLRCCGYDPGQQVLDVEVTCSRGTYVRVLAAKIGRDLGCGAHLLELRRTASGPFSVHEAIPGAELFGDEGAALLAAGQQHIETALARIDSAALSTCQSEQAAV